jgi:hypothetical protein
MKVWMKKVMEMMGVKMEVWWGGEGDAGAEGCGDGYVLVRKGRGPWSQEAVAVWKEQRRGQ